MTKGDDQSNYSIRKKCAWCGEFENNWITSQQSDKVSHGVCSNCADKIKDDND